MEYRNRNTTTDPSKIADSLEHEFGFDTHSYTVEDISHQDIRALCDEELPKRDIGYIFRKNWHTKSKYIP